MNRSLVLLILQLTNFVLPPAFGLANTRIDYIVPSLRIAKTLYVQDVLVFSFLCFIGYNTLINAPDGLTALVWIVANCVLARFCFASIAPFRRPLAVQYLLIAILFAVLVLNILTIVFHIDLTQVYFNQAYQRSELSRFEYRGTLRAFFPFIEPRQLAAFCLFFVYVSVVTGLSKWRDVCLFLLSALIIYLTMSKSAIYASVALGACLVIMLCRVRTTLLLTIFSVVSLMTFGWFGETSRFALPNIDNIRLFFEAPDENRVIGYGWDTYLTGVYMSVQSFAEHWFLGVGLGNDAAFANSLNLRRQGAQGIFGIFVETGLVGIFLHFTLLSYFYKSVQKNINKLYLWSYIILLFLQFNLTGLYSLTNPMWIAQSALFCSLFWGRK